MDCISQVISLFQEFSLCCVCDTFVGVLFKQGSTFSYIIFSDNFRFSPVASYQAWVKTCQKEAALWEGKVWALLTEELVLPTSAFHSPELLPLLLSPPAALPTCTVVGMDIPAGFIQKPPKPELAYSKNAQTSECV